MVQEFHVLRCFSCRTFQVQQVKKSKKWSCKMCGEKQSLMKEYGRGTGADCRRHVQKLNSLRGEMLEVENESAWTQWEEESEIKGKVDPGEKNESWVQTGHEQGGSRWNKYVEKKEEGPGCDEDEQEEAEHLSTDKEPYRRRSNPSKKRKKSFNSGAACGRYFVGGDADEVDAAVWDDTGPSQGRWHHDTLKPRAPHALFAASLCTSTNQQTDVAYDSPAASLGSKHGSGVHYQSTKVNKQSSAEVSSKPQPLVSLSDVSAASSSHQHHVETGKQREAKDSKWTQFLSPVCVEDRDERDRGSGEWSDGDHAVVMPVSTVPGNNAGCKVFREDQKESAFEKLSRCVNQNVCKEPSLPTATIAPINVGSQKTVCVQRRSTKGPCPASSFSTLFHTDEDFDDAY